MLQKLKVKRGRGRNFSVREKRIFSEIINEKRFLSVLGNKKTDIESNKLKCEIWVEIANIFNRQTGEDQRTPHQLRTYYDNMKARRRRTTDEGLISLLSEEEEKILLELTQPHLDVINSDKPEFINIKKIVWDLITNQYNSRVTRSKDSVFLENHFKYKYKQQIPEVSVKLQYIKLIICRENIFFFREKKIIQIIY